MTNNRNTKEFDIEIKKALSKNTFINDVCISFEESKYRKFDKYKNKIKTQILEIIKNNYKQNGYVMNLNNLEDVIYSVVYLFFNGEITDKNLAVTDKYILKTRKVDFTFLDNNIILGYLANTKDLEFGIFNLIDESIKENIRLFINCKYTSEIKITKSNYNTVVDVTNDEGVYLFACIVNDVINGIYSINRDNSLAAENFKNIIEEFQENKNEELKKENNLLKQINKEKDLELQNLKNKIELLEKEKQSIIKNTGNHLINNIRICEKQKRLGDNYKKKLSLLSLEHNIFENIIDNKKENIKNIDYNATYLFIVDDELNFYNKIKEKFPNSITKNKNINIENFNIDAVIAITSNIDHATYYGIKKQSKAKNITFIHCLYKNIDIIEGMIFNEINKEL